MACFSKKEWNNFGHFLKLPYLNKVHKKHHEIYEYLKTYYWLQKEKNGNRKTTFPSSDKLSSIFFPDAKNSRPLNKHLSRLHQNARLFLASQSIMNDSKEVDLISIRKAISDKEYHYAKVATKRVLTEIEQEGDDWFLRYQLTMTNSKLHLEMQGLRDRISFLKATENSLDDFYIIAKLNNYCHQLAIQQSVNNFKISENQKNFEAYLDHYHSNTPSHTAVFQLYYNVLNVIRDRQVQSSIKTVDHLLSVNKNKFSPYKVRQVQNLLLNHCTHLLHSQKMTPSEILKMHQLLLSSGILSTEEGSFHIIYYKNILVLAIITKSFIWLKEKFIPQYTKMLLPEYQVTAIDYGDAEYHLSQKSWKKAFDCAYKIPSKSQAFKFVRGTILIQAAYEMERANFKDLDDKYDTSTTIQNFKAQMTYKNIRVSREVKAYRNFVKCIKRIYNLEKAKKKSDRAVRLQKIIQEEGLIARKMWLNEKLKKYLQ